MSQRTQKHMENFHNNCRAQAIRLTPQRVEIFRQLASTTAHPDAETIYNNVRKTMPTVSLDTIYRTLKFFEEHGLVLRVSVENERARYDAQTSEHTHFVCEKCGRIIDVSAAAKDAKTLKEQVSAEHNTKVFAMHLLFRGLCAECNGTKADKKA